MLSGLFFHNFLDQSISNSRVSACLHGLVRFIITMFIEIPVFNANSVDLDQTSHSEASDLRLHCLSIILSGSLTSRLNTYMYLC